MSLRRQSLSPTAQLLRNSRLFSLPNPLPRPPVATAYGAGESPTATLPFPTHQAIATTPTSAARGDWGLKRPLPSRARILQTSKPVLKIKALDTVEHVTDFDSASDHVRTREKFEELGIPVLRGLGSFYATDPTALPPRSSFEARADVTSYDTSEGLDGRGIYLEAVKKAALERAARSAAAKKKGLPIPQESAAQERFRPFEPPPVDVLMLQNTRWRHEGPWLPGMSADEFTTYLQSKIASRREEFDLCVEEYVKGEIYMRRSQAARDDESIPLDPREAKRHRRAQEEQWSNISRDDIEAGMRALRAQCAANPLTCDLVTKIIIPFFRLPPMKLKSTIYSVNANETEATQYRFSDETTPHSTHPSAGLSYLRTNSILSNHPILGPQAAPTPITSRMVQPREVRGATLPTARLGVAGFVTNDEYVQTGMHGRRTVSDVDRLDLDTPGGKKLFVRPHHASVTPEGRVLVRISRATGPEVAVARGELDDIPPVRRMVSDSADALWSTGSSGVAELDAALGQKGTALEEAQKNMFFSRLAAVEQNLGKGNRA